MQFAHGAAESVLQAINANEALPLNAARFRPAQQGVSQVGLFVEIAGDASAAVSVTLVPVVTRLVPGVENTPVQYDFPSEKKTVAGVVAGDGTPYREYVEMRVPPGWKWALRVATVNGANAVVGVMATRGTDFAL